MMDTVKDMVLPMSFMGHRVVRTIRSEDRISQDQIATSTKFTVSFLILPNDNEPYEFFKLCFREFESFLKSAQGRKLIAESEESMKKTVDDAIMSMLENIR